MATQKHLNEEIRERFIKMVAERLKQDYDDVLRTNSNEIAIPCLDESGDDKYIVITFKVPTGSRDGDAYDGYSEAQAYEMKCKQKAEDAEKAKAKKEAKIARDKKMREEKARLKAERKAPEVE